MEPTNIPPSTKDRYKQDFEKGVTLFQQSLSEYQNVGDFEQKKIMLKDVMDKALDVINQSAKGFLSQKNLQQPDQLQKDYEAYLSNASSDTYNKLNQDLERLKKLG